ncbi:type VI secretion system baseplate subunit TssG [Fluoribacter dumoffii]|uniref:type VI secretion system baseplate subunit TssG n=1 Tax=Fluoribacter dumoffii TaxID=463 RepID=UPI002243B8F5|nr:type VI secretion system baseplate subunit TssG [Fluoribacter dumoffii]MCW8416756.1 type VI secretion system baseplate subunit TssG [Fluoribacter dumoffii]MCW8455404.1 type VI secretion system baseplate subunit TssG [Fluoribacter dumoffii]MCW8460518.1 type VI secretion system baseplate subunit TssG [Fluoribacter dumoffii]MCW8483999.1 type VI secretion system baseplate subunit TssG [Fluoribacter dumoffii]
MATEVKQPELNILEKLLTQPKAFNFFQAIRLIGHILNYEAKHGIKGKLEIIPLLTLAFPETDIHEIQLHRDTHQFTLIATFFSLYGTTSPLPTFYTEELIEDNDLDSKEMKSLLDIFHKRLYKILFRAWSKNRIFEEFAEQHDTIYKEALYGFIGLAGKEIREKIPNHNYLLRYSSHWISAHKSIWSLKNLLNDYFKVPINIYSFFRCIQEIPEEQYCLLGKANHHLSKTAYLGSQFKSNSNSLLISIGPLSADVFPKFLANAQNTIQLRLLLQLYVKEPFSYFIEVILDKGCFKPIRLASETTSILGVVSWLSPQKNIEMFKVRYWLN